METELTRMIEGFERGRVTRRQLLAHLAAVVAAAGAGGALAAPEVAAPAGFHAVGLNHIALRVTDVARSRDFYMKWLGMTVAREDPESNCFLSCGPNFITLFRGDSAGLDHYCYSIENYNAEEAAKKLSAENIESRIESGRIYFSDPDGLTVQLSSADHHA